MLKKLGKLDLLRPDEGSVPVEGAVDAAVVIEDVIAVDDMGEDRTDEADEAELLSAETADQVSTTPGQHPPAPNRSIMYHRSTLLARGRNAPFTATSTCFFSIAARACPPCRARRGRCATTRPSCARAPSRTARPARTRVSAAKALARGGGRMGVTAGTQMWTSARRMRARSDSEHSRAQKEDRVGVARAWRTKRVSGNRLTTRAFVGCCPPGPSLD